eukprot:TRINITY_DN27652_c0_g1_i1.p2 TRINITY_DN27652_c0_g1~~TRINITY_DN27652_c0_g1_i1.p2  ORF type:complete len:381 (+),score=74.48 TRINITY_DN27652_c0_g1_i1:1397-2539(+)
MLAFHLRSTNNDGFLDPTTGVRTVPVAPMAEPTTTEGLRKTLMTIVATNGFSTDVRTGGRRQQMVMVYLGTSRCNHSCDPNAQRVNTGDGKARVVALEDISAGSGITVSYLTDTQAMTDYATRQEYLKTWGIDGCLCAVCTSGCDPMRVFRCAKCSDGVRAASTGPTDELLPCESPSCGARDAADAAWFVEEESIKAAYLAIERRPQSIGDTRGGNVDALLKRAKAARMAAAHWIVERLHDMLCDYYAQHGRQRGLMIANNTARLAAYDRWAGGGRKVCQHRAWVNERIGDLHAEAGDTDGARAAYERAGAELQLLYGGIHELRDLKDESHLVINAKLHGLANPQLKRGGARLADEGGVIADVLRSGPSSPFFLDFLMGL